MKREAIRKLDQWIAEQAQAKPSPALVRSQ